MTNLLQQIKELQHTNRGRAEALLLDFVRQMFPSLDVTEIQLRPQAISLNSFNGFLTTRDNTQLFFKTHTEEDNQINEYYNAQLLAEVGYPIIQPIYSSTRAGQHLLIYNVVESPSVFDVAWRLEAGDQLEVYTQLSQAQQSADRQLANIYRKTLRWQTQHENMNAPIHQLFIHRLTGGRLARFYGPGIEVELPGKFIRLGDLFTREWRINGQIYTESFAEIVKRISQNTLAFSSMPQGNPSITGHGDAHNGNVFLREEHGTSSLLYFDPAFAGQHHPLLDLAKPIFHNVFAMWLYYPHVVDKQLSISLGVSNHRIDVEYDYPLPQVRYLFLRSKIQNVLIPVLQDLKSRGWLQSSWREYFKAALFCCPLLTLNLNVRRFPPSIRLLAFAMAMEMGSESQTKRSAIDQTLDEVEAVLIASDSRL